MDNIVVSICCITYNHERFIRDAIEGFLIQRINSPFEIIIHDDASTDNTTEIIREYESKYPQIIKPIYQKENKYSKGIELIVTIACAQAHGKYIALCEGDDYWTDPYKLQKQVDYMEEHPECSLCFHNAVIVDINKTPTGKQHVPYSIYNNKYFNGENRKYNSGELAVLNFIPTASLLFPRKLACGFPDFYYNAIYRDLPLKLILTYKGYAYYINEIMSAYRTGIEGSATYILDSTNEMRIKHYNGYMDILDNFNKYTNYNFSSYINEAKTIREFKVLLSNRDLKTLKSDKYKVYYDKLGIEGKVKLYISKHYPNAYKLLTKLKTWI